MWENTFQIDKVNLYSFEKAKKNNEKEIPEEKDEIGEQCFSEPIATIDTD